MNLPGKGGVEKRGRRAIVNPYTGMTNADLMILKSAVANYSHVLFKATTDFRTWGILLIEAYRRRPGVTYSERKAAEDMGAQLIGLWLKYQGRAKQERESAAA